MIIARARGAPKSPQDEGISETEPEGSHSGAKVEADGTPEELDDSKVAKGKTME